MLRFWVSEGSRLKFIGYKLFTTKFVGCPDHSLICMLVIESQIRNMNDLERILSIL